MIKKDCNNPKLHMLMIIHIIKANYNFATKILWSRILKRAAERKGNLMDSNCGSRKGRITAGIAIVKELHYDIAHLRLHQYIQMENDTKS